MYAWDDLIYKEKEVEVSLSAAAWGNGGTNANQ